MDNKLAFRVTFRPTGGKVQSWERFAPSLFLATRDALRALDLEYPAGAEVLTVERIPDPRGDHDKTPSWVRVPMAVLATGADWDTFGTYVLGPLVNGDRPLVVRVTTKDMKVRDGYIVDAVVAPEVGVETCGLHLRLTDDTANPIPDTAPEWIDWDELAEIAIY